MHLCVGVLALLLSLCVPASVLGDPGRIMGGGNIPIKGDAARFRALNAVGAGVCRIPIDVRAYWNGTAATPEKADAAVLMARRFGITPMILFEYYTRWHGDLGGREKWHAIGRAFATRFAPNSDWLRSQGIADWGVTFFSAMNEPMWRRNNPEPIPTAAYAAALEGLADGVHSVDPGLRVNPGGFQEVPLFKNRNPYIKAIAPLYNAGKLAAVDIHRYWDVQYLPMDPGPRFSLQRQFEQAKREAGITADVLFYASEINFKKRLVTEDQAAAGFLTALWDALTVVGNDGQRVTQFVLPWNIFHLADKDEHYGMCTALDPWTPTARGKVLRAVCQLTRGMEFVSWDPKGTGVSVLEGGGRKLWVWQNRKGWSSLHGTSFTLTGIPKGAHRVDVHGWDGRRRTLPLAGQERLTIDDLPAGETLMFLATPDDAK